jgi:ubiquinone/menaquinone biosynthesis C-methylase UbiE
MSLPFRDASCDAVISIAVLHHLTTAARRKNAVKELVRVTRPEGKVLVTVWAFEQVGRGPWQFLGAKCFLLTH